MDRGLKSQFTADEWQLLRSLKSPALIQNWLNVLPFNFEKNGETNYSPRRVILEGRAHCLEGAMLAAAALRAGGERPLILDLEASGEDQDHVVALFKRHGCWGAISKTNHAVLRYREPVYRTIRELVMSYFHEYFLQSDGRKTLRGYAVVDLSRFDKKFWMTADENLDYVVEHLWRARHQPILTLQQIKLLRSADQVEIQAGAIQEYLP